MSITFQFVRSKELADIAIIRQRAEVWQGCTDTHWWLYLQQWFWDRGVPK